MAETSNKLRVIRNIGVLIIGIALVGIGFWSVAYTTQGVWYALTDFVGGGAMILLSAVWSTRYKSAARELSIQYG